MQVRLLGTGSAEGCPGLFCDCEVCRRSRVEGGKNLRSRSAALIDGTLMVDLSPDVLHQVLTQNLDLTRIEHLLFTHAHHDHFAIQELQYSSWMFVRNPLPRTIQVLCPPDAAEAIRCTLDLEALPLSIHCLVPWERVEAGPWAITPILAQHDPAHVCYNHVIERDGKTLLYATDTGWYTEQTWTFLKNVRLDGVVLECSKGLDEGGYKAHMSIPEVIRMRERLAADGIMDLDCPLVTTHHSHLSGLLHAELESHLTPHNIQAGFDGLVFQV